jgi:tetrahydromethanopterin S-methyltransferase subunit E
MAREEDKGGSSYDLGTQVPPQAQRETRPSLDRILAGMLGRRAFVALQLGASLIATAAGLVVYFFLASLHLNSLVALALGFFLALVVRQAARYLALEWLLRQARQRPPSP